MFYSELTSRDLDEQAWRAPRPKPRSTMLRANQIIGKPVVASNSGKQIDVVKDLIFDHEAHRLLGFLTSRGGWSGSARILPWSAALTIGLRAIIARSGNLVVEAASIPRVQELLEGGESVLGKPVHLADGTLVSTLSDVFFEKSTGIIKGYEITDGGLSEKSSSRLFVPAPLALIVDGSTVQVSPEVSALIEQSRAEPLRRETR